MTMCSVQSFKHLTYLNSCLKIRVTLYQRGNKAAVRICIYHIGGVITAARAWCTFMGFQKSERIAGSLQ